MLFFEVGLKVFFILCFFLSLIGIFCKLGFIFDKCLVCVKVWLKCVWICWLLLIIFCNFLI